jgi:hypothetical protein
MAVDTILYNKSLLFYLWDFLGFKKKAGVCGAEPPAGTDTKKMTIFYHKICLFESLF